MKYYRCKCGENESWSSMGPRPCTWCKKCESDLAGGPESHDARRPHKVIAQKVKTDNGESILSTCIWCFKMKRELLELGEPIEEVVT